MEQTYDISWRGNNRPRHIFGTAGWTIAVRADSAEQAISWFLRCYDVPVNNLVATPVACSTIVSSAGKEVPKNRKSRHIVVSNRRGKEPIVAVDETDLESMESDLEDTEQVDPADVLDSVIEEGSQSLPRRKRASGVAVPKEAQTRKSRGGGKATVKRNGKASTAEDALVAEHHRGKHEDLAVDGCEPCTQGIPAQPQLIPEGQRGKATRGRKDGAEKVEKPPKERKSRGSSETKAHEPWENGAIARRNRKSGFTVTVYDTEHPAVPLDGKGGRWIVECTEHGQRRNYEKKAEAFNAKDPAEFCKKCAKALGNGKSA
jgi:hypothetical protein